MEVPISHRYHLLSQIRKSRHRVVPSLAQVHTATKLWSQDYTAENPALECVRLTSPEPQGWKALRL